MIGLHFEIEGIREIQEALGATDKQVKLSMHRAMDRTAATLRKMSQKGFQSELGLRRLAFIRKRLREMKFRGATFDGVRLWYGLNDMPISYLKGGVRASRRAGASKNSQIGNFHYPHGFILNNPKNGRGRSVFYRTGPSRYPLKEESAPIKDRMDVYIEDNIFDQVPDIFWHHFSSDLRSRVKFLS